MGRQDFFSIVLRLIGVELYKIRRRMLAKVGAILVCGGIGVFGMTLLGILTGQLFTPFTPFHQSFDFLNTAWIGHAFLLILYLLLGLIIYALMALFFATLGKATAAGIG